MLQINDLSFLSIKYMFIKLLKNNINHTFSFDII